MLRRETDTDAQTFLDKLNGVLDQIQDSTTSTINFIDETPDPQEQHDILHQALPDIAQTLEALHWHVLTVTMALSKSTDAEELERFIGHLTYSMVRGYPIRKPFLPTYNQQGKVHPEHRPEP